VLAYETDLLEYPDIFEGSTVMEGLVAELAEGARAEMAIVEEHGGAGRGSSTYMKASLVESHRERIARIERGEQIVVGINKYTETEDSPLATGEDGGILTVDPGVEAEQQAELEAWRKQRDNTAVDAALDRTGPRRAERREHHGGDAHGRPRRRDHRRMGAGTARRLRLLPRADRRRRGGGADSPRRGELCELRDEVARVSDQLGRTLKILVGKPGLDGHSNGAEQIAVRARDAAWTSSTRASASRRPRSRARRSTRACT
jgi:(2R)-ethylmalonyl-CoA mutase